MQRLILETIHKYLIEEDWKKFRRFTRTNIGQGHLKTHGVGEKQNRHPKEMAYQVPKSKDDANDKHLNAYEKWWEEKSSSTSGNDAENFEKWLSNDKGIYNRAKIRGISDFYDKYTALVKLGKIKHFTELNKSGYYDEDSEETISPPMVLYQYITQNQKKINDYLRKQKINNSEEGEDYDKLYDDGDLLVVVPRTWEGSCKYGRGSMWCTSMSTNKKHFDTYSSSGDLVRFIKRSWQKTCPNITSDLEHGDKELRKKLRNSLSFECKMSMVSYHKKYNGTGGWVNRIDDSVNLMDRPHPHFVKWKKTIPQKVWDIVGDYGGTGIKLSDAHAVIGRYFVDNSYYPYMVDISEDPLLDEMFNVEMPPGKWLRYFDNKNISKYIVGGKKGRVIFYLEQKDDGKFPVMTMKIVTFYDGGGYTNQAKHTPLKNGEEIHRVLDGIISEIS